MLSTETTTRHSKSVASNLQKTKKRYARQLHRAQAARRKRERQDGRKRERERERLWERVILSECGRVAGKPMGTLHNHHGRSADTAGKYPKTFATLTATSAADRKMRRNSCAITFILFRRLLCQSASQSADSHRRLPQTSPTFTPTPTATCIHIHT